MRLQFMRVLRALIAVAAVTAVVAVPAAIADGGAPGVLETSPGVSGAFDETPSAWFVELKGSADAFRADAKANGINVKERFSYTKVWNGLSVSVARSDSGALATLPSVSAVYPVLKIAAPDPGATISPDLATAIAMTRSRPCPARRLDRRGREGRRDGHGPRLEPPGSRRLLRSGLPCHDRLGLRRRQLQRR